MSFAFDVKNEISGIKIDARHCRIAMLGGIFLCGAINYSQNEFFLVTENPKIVRRSFELIRGLTGAKELKINRSGHSFRVSLTDKTEIKKLFDLFKIRLTDTGQNIFDAENIDLHQTCCKRAFIMGCFLGGGSLSHPDKSYHFELVSKREKAAVLINDILTGFEIKSKILKRKESYIAYSKDSESIAAVLLVLGAANSLMELENIRIKKYLRNKVNRTVNFETSNLYRAADAAARQIDDINLIAEKIGIKKLDKNLQAAAVLRLENPTSSLQELSELSGDLSKSCLNHRFRRIREIAEELKK